MYVKKNQRRLAEKDPPRQCSRLLVQLLTKKNFNAFVTACVSEDFLLGNGSEALS